MIRHATNPDWLVDDRGHVWRRERFWTCEHHRHGPPHDDEIDDEHVACAALVRGLWSELGTVAAIQTITGATIGEIEQSRQELGLCCVGHRWRNTGKMLEVSSIEVFAHEHLRLIASFSARRPVLLDLLAAGAPVLAGGAVTIPIVVDNNKRGRQFVFPNRYRLDRPGAPPTVE